MVNAQWRQGGNPKVYRGRHRWNKEDLEMTQQRRAWVAPIMTVLFLSVFLAGCPKRPEVTETAPKAIGPQGAIAMSANAILSP